MSRLEGSKAWVGWVQKPWSLSSGLGVQRGAEKSSGGGVREPALILSYHSVVVQDADTVLIHSNPHQSALLGRHLCRLGKQEKPIRQSHG